MSTANSGGSAASERESESTMPVGDSRPVNGEKEEERTLTDHLNKKLLQSFLERMTAGTANIPRLPDSRQEVEEDSQEFDD